MAELDKTLLSSGIKPVFAKLKDLVKDKLKRFELFGQFDENNFFPTIGEAVAAYLDSFDVDGDDRDLWQCGRS